jgi:hypothetical protein
VAANGGVMQAKQRLDNLEMEQAAGSYTDKVRAQPVPAAGAAKPLTLTCPATSPPPPTVRYAMVAQGDASFVDRGRGPDGRNL